jgi:hypothetical protein
MSDAENSPDSTQPNILFSEVIPRGPTSHYCSVENKKIAV